MSLLPRRRPIHYHRWLVFVGIALAPALAVAQAGLEPGETRVTRGTTEAPEETDDSDLDETDSPEDASSESNDRPPPRPGVEQFDEVGVDRVRPDSLPPPSTSETDIPAVLRNTSGNLPEPPSVERLEETSEHVRKRVFELVSVQSPDAPGDATPIVHRGHAVLVSSDEGPPILVTTYFWLRESEKLFLAPSKLSDDKSESSDRSEPTAERRSLEEMTVDGKTEEWLEKRRDSLVRARLYRPDEHRNLTTVVPDDLSELDLPDEGLELFDLEEDSPVRLYGYSPQTGSGLTQTKLLESHPDEKSLVYYLQTEFDIVYGAPIVSTSGQLLVLTAFQHPNNSDIVLTVPPVPIAAYIDDVLSSL